MAKWGEYMSLSYDSKFTNRSIHLDCCNKEVALEDLNYHFDVGFSKFVIELINPSCPVTDNVLAQLEQIVGSELKCIYVNV